MSHRDVDMACLDQVTFFFMSFIVITTWTLLPVVVAVLLVRHSSPPCELTFLLGLTRKTPFSLRTAGSKLSSNPNLKHQS